MIETLLVIWLYPNNNMQSITVTRFPTVEACDAARASLLQAYPWSDDDWVHFGTLYPERVRCVPVTSASEVPE